LCDRAPEIRHLDRDNSQRDDGYSAR